MSERYLTIFRAANNFIQVGDVGKTPTMRWGFVNRPIVWRVAGGLLWPERKAVAPPRWGRRRGRMAVAARRTSMP